MLRGARIAAALVRTAVANSGADNIGRMAAALAYYSLFALAPIVFIALALAGFAMGSIAAQAQLAGELDLLAGPTLSAAIQGILASYHQAATPAATLIGLLALAFGGSGIFLELRESLDAILGGRVRRHAGILRLIKIRSLAFAMVLLGSLLLVAGMAASVAFAGFLKDASGLFGATSVIVGLLGTVVLLALATVAFAQLYRQLPRPKPRWADAWLGAAAAAVLFVAGEFAVGLYLGRSAPVSPIGGAGSVFAVLVWVYYSAQIVYFGAELVKACALRRSAGATSRSP